MLQISSHKSIVIIANTAIKTSIPNIPTSSFKEEKVPKLELKQKQSVYNILLLSTSKGHIKQHSSKGGTEH